METSLPVGQPQTKVKLLRFHLRNVMEGMCKYSFICFQSSSKSSFGTGQPHLSTTWKSQQLLLEDLNIYRIVIHSRFVHQCKLHRDSKQTDKQLS